MPDISLCPGNDCPRKETCYRHTATPSKYMQSYFVDPPYEKDNKEECKYYWRIVSMSELKRLDSILE